MQRVRELCGAKITVVQVLVIAEGKFSTFQKQTHKGLASKQRCACVWTLRGKNPSQDSLSTCRCFPKRSDSDKRSGCLVICPQRLVTVFETISPPKTSSSKICHGHLKTAANDVRIIGNKYYSSARKVSSREDFIEWVIPVSFPSQLLRAELHRFPGLLSLLLPATTFPKRSKGSTNRYPRLGWTPEEVRGIGTGKQTSEGK